MIIQLLNWTIIWSDIQSNKVLTNLMYCVNYVEQSAIQCLNLQNDLLILIVFKMICLFCSFELFSFSCKHHVCHFALTGRELIWNTVSKYRITWNINSPCALCNVNFSGVRSYLLTYSPTSSVAEAVLG